MHIDDCILAYTLIFELHVYKYDILNMASFDHIKK